MREGLKVSVFDISPVPEHSLRPFGLYVVDQMLDYGSQGLKWAM
jgi:hypothetical protein